MFKKESDKKTFTAADIRRYIDGRMSPAERNELERAALSDPFLEDALEGYASLADPARMPSDLEDLHTRLGDSLSPGGQKRVLPVTAAFFSTDSRLGSWLRIAAAVVVIGAAGILLYVRNHRTSSPRYELAAKQAELRSAPAGVAAPTDSTTSVESPAEKASPTGVGSPTEDKAAPAAAVPPSPAGAVPPPPAAPAPGAPMATVAPPGHQRRLVPPLAKADARALAESSAGAPAHIDYDTAATIAAAPQPSRPTMNLRFVPEKRRAIPNTTTGTADKAIAYGSTTQRLGSPMTFGAKITDPRNQPVVGATVQAEPSGQITTTDENGYFHLQTGAAAADDSIVVTAIGFEKKKYAVEQVTPASPLQLSEANNNLNEVVVIGYGTAKSKKTTRWTAGAYRVSNDTTELQPIDGWSSFNSYVSHNAEIPSEVRRQDLHGDVILSFRVDEDGNPIGISVDKSLCVPCDTEAIRLLKKGPQWTKKNSNSTGHVKVHF